MNLKMQLKSRPFYSASPLSNSYYHYAYELVEDDTTGGIPCLRALDTPRSVPTNYLPVEFFNNEITAAACGSTDDLVDFASTWGVPLSPLRSRAQRNRDYLVYSDNDEWRQEWHPTLTKPLSSLEQTVDYFVSLAKDKQQAAFKNVRRAGKGIAEAEAEAYAQTVWAFHCMDSDQSVDERQKSNFQSLVSVAEAWFSIRAVHEATKICSFADGLVYEDEFVKSLSLIYASPKDLRGDPIEAAKKAYYEFPLAKECVDTLINPKDDTSEDFDLSQAIGWLAYDACACIDKAVEPLEQRRPLGIEMLWSGETSDAWSHLVSSQELAPTYFNGGNFADDDVLKLACVQFLNIINSNTSWRECPYKYCNRLFKYQRGVRDPGSGLNVPPTRGEAVCCCKSHDVMATRDAKNEMKSIADKMQPSNKRDAEKSLSTDEQRKILVTLGAPDEALQANLDNSEQLKEQLLKLFGITAPTARLHLTKHGVSPWELESSTYYKAVDLILGQTTGIGLSDEEKGAEHDLLVACVVLLADWFDAEDFSLYGLIELTSLCGITDGDRFCFRKRSYNTAIAYMFYQLVGGEKYVKVSGKYEWTDSNFVRMWDGEQACALHGTPPSKGMKPDEDQTTSLYLSACNKASEIGGKSEQRIMLDIKVRLFGILALLRSTRSNDDLALLTYSEINEAKKLEE